MTGSAVGFGTTSQDGTNPGLLNPTATSTDVYNVGQGMSTAEAEGLDGSEASSCSTRWHSQSRKSP